jgi:hypothetical protein
VVYEQLRATPEEVPQRHLTDFAFEAVVLLDPNPGQRLSLPGHLIAAAGQRFLGLEQFEPSRPPSLGGLDGVSGHGLLLYGARRVASPAQRTKL